MSGDPGLAAAVWDLEPLVGAAGDDGARALIVAARVRTVEFTARYKGRVRELSAADFVVAVSVLADIRELVDRVEAYAGLRGAVDGADPSVGQLRGVTETATAEIAARLLFFELEWMAMSDARAETLLAEAGDRLSFAAHHLRRWRARRPYLLSDAEERVLAETSVPRQIAWKRLYADNANALTVEFGGRTAPLSEAVARLFSPDRDSRIASMTALGPGLERGLETRVAAYNQVLAEHAVNDRLRGYRTWLSARNLANETTDAAVRAQLSAIENRADLPRRWNRCKAKLLGIDQLRTADVMAPLPTAARDIPFNHARNVVVSSWGGFSMNAAEIMDRFFSEGRIDAPMRTGKPPGAFCESTSAERHAYVLINYSGQPTETMALAHELGHGLHHELNRSQGPLQRRTSIPMLEVASTFSEALVFETLINEAATDGERLNLIAARIDDAMGNVFLTLAYFNAETAFHTRYREQGELTVKQYSDMWATALTDMWGDTMTLDPTFRLWWSFIPHMIESPGYLYSYSFGLLTAWSAYGRYRDVGAPFVEDYLAMLAAGGSRTPKELVAMLGLDVEAPDYWNAGLDLLDELLTEAERLSGVR
jgi:oligoendopeptidase F